jgi:hypothetical protein
MGRISYHGRLATRFTHPRLVTNTGTIFVPPHPVDLEAYARTVDGNEPAQDPSLSAYERLAAAERYRLVLSLSWGWGAAARQTVDLGLLHADEGQLFVVHQLNDDAGTALIVAYLASEAPGQLFRVFLLDYLSSRGSGYTVTLPALLPQSVWIVQPEVAPDAAVAAGLLGLVAPGSVDWVGAGVAGWALDHPPRPPRAPLVA